MASRIPLIVLLTCSFSAFSADELVEPFFTSNLNPFVQAQAIPTTRSAQLTNVGQFSWQLQTEFANHFTDSRDGTETITLDGETHKATFSIGYGLTDRWELGIQIPYLRHSGGSMDSFIENWHDVFGLPNGGREDVPQDQLDFSYTAGTLPPTRLASSGSGIGDISLTAGYRLQKTDDSVWTLRAGVKLGTGDASDLTGSEGESVFLSLHHSNASLINHPDWYFHGSIGVSYLQDSEVLDSLREDWVIYGSATVAWHVTPRMSLKAQLDLHSAAYDSDLRELGDTAAQLIVGGSLQLSERLLLDISVSEDIITDASPDVVLQLGLRTTF